MFHMFNFHFKIAVGALVALSIFVGSRSFAAELNEPTNPMLLAQDRVAEAGDGLRQARAELRSAQRDILGVIERVYNLSSAYGTVQINMDIQKRIELSRQLETQLHYHFSEIQLQAILQAHNVQDILNAITLEEANSENPNEVAGM